ATGFAASVAGRSLASGGVLVWCETTSVTRDLGAVYGPGLAAFGIMPERLVMVRCRDRRELLWAFEEALRCRAVACAIGEVGELDLNASRRLQLAAEEGGALGLLLRAKTGGRRQAGREAAHAPLAALTRWQVEPLRRDGRTLWQVDLWQVKGGAPGSWEIEAGPVGRVGAAGTAPIGGLPQDRGGEQDEWSLSFDPSAAMADRAPAAARKAAG
ncbi:MAG: hypothetical protein R3C97_06890, partial [Geminicoccaceae bacterium]